MDLLVFLQVGTGLKCHLADVAGEWSDIHVDIHMRAQLTCSCELNITNATDKRLLTCVSSHVNVEVCWSFEVLFTDIAFEIPLQAVRHFVFLQTLCPFKSLFANVAESRFFTMVICKSFLGPEALGAVGTLDPT